MYTAVGQPAGSAGPVTPSVFGVLSVLLRFHYLQAGIMSQVIDPNSADSEINYVTRVSASPAVTPSQRGFPSQDGEPRGGHAEAILQ